MHFTNAFCGAQWLIGRVLDSRPKGRGFEPHRRHCVVSLSKKINPSLVLVQPRKTRPFITDRLMMGRKESNQTNKQNKCILKVLMVMIFFPIFRHLLIVELQKARLVKNDFVRGNSSALCFPMEEVGLVPVLRTYTKSYFKKSVSLSSP